MPGRRKQGQVERAVARDLRDLEGRAAGVKGSGEAAALLALARALDSDSDAVLSARSSAARELREGLAALRLRVPEAPQVDRLDELAGRRAVRKAVVS